MIRKEELDCNRRIFYYHKGTVTVLQYMHPAHGRHRFMNLHTGKPILIRAKNFYLLFYSAVELAREIRQMWEDQVNTYAPLLEEDANSNLTWYDPDTGVASFGVHFVV